MKKIVLLLGMVLCFVNKAYAETWNCGDHGDNVKCMLDDDGIFTISGIGAMGNYSYNDKTGENNQPWGEAIKQIKHIVVNDGVTSIGKNAFQNATELQTVTGMKDVQIIGFDSFAWAENLSKIDMPNVSYVDNGAFWDNKNLKSVDMPKVSYVHEHAFMSDTMLVYIGLPTTDNDGFLLNDSGNRIIDENGNPVRFSSLGFYGTYLRYCSVTNRAACGSCGDNYIKRGVGCVSDCGDGYLVKEGSCISDENGCGDGYDYNESYNECLRTRYTLPEADAATSNDNENMIEWIFE